METKKQDQVALFFILFATAFLFRNVIRFDFVWDDVFLIPKNPYISGPIHFFEIFTAGFWKFSSVGDNIMPYYRPIVTLAYMLQYKIFGLYAGGYHLVSLILHLFNIVLVWNLSFKFKLEHWGRMACTAIFAFHPVQVGTVCFISCQGDLLATLFSLLAIQFWFLEKPIRWMCLIWMLFAMLSKEAAVILPIVVFFMDWLVQGKRTWSFEKISPLAVWFVYFVMRYFGLRYNGYELESSQSVWNTAGSFRTFLSIGRLMFPFPNAPESGVPEIAIYQKLFYHFGYLFLIVITMIKTKMSPVVRFFAIWFFATTLLIADWFSFNLRFSDQLLYYPLIPICLLVGYFIREKNKSFFVSLITLVFIFISSTQIKHWQNNLVFWANAFQKDKQNPVYGLNYAGALQDVGRKKDGCDLMEHTLKIAEKKYHPVYVNLILYNLGNCNMDQNPKLAEEYYQKALAVYKNDFDSRKNLIIVLMGEHKNQEAVDQARILVQEKPDYKDGWLILSDTLKANGNLVESKQAKEKANELENRL